MGLDITIYSDRTKILIAEHSPGSNSPTNVLLDVPIECTTKKQRYRPSLKEYLFGMDITLRIAMTKQEEIEATNEYKAAYCQACVDGLVGTCIYLDEVCPCRLLTAE